MTRHSHLIKNFFYLSNVIFVLACIYFAEKAVKPLRPFLAEKVTSATPSHNAKLMQDLADNTHFQFEFISNINFYGFFIFCLFASYLYFVLGERKHYLVALLTHFICLCISYFWVSDMLFVFKQHASLLTVTHNASMMIVPIKLLTAALFATGFLMLIRAMRNNQNNADKEV